MAQPSKALAAQPETLVKAKSRWGRCRRLDSKNWLDKGWNGQMMSSWINAPRESLFAITGFDLIEMSPVFLLLRPGSFL